MNQLLTILALIALAGCGRENPTSELDIVGGRLVTSKDGFIKHVVSLMTYEGKTFCTGSLVGKQLVLTAAHCVDKSGKFLVGFGRGGKTQKYSRSNLREVEKVAMNREYIDDLGSPADQEAREKKGVFISDVAFIKLKERAPKGYEPVKMLPPNWEPSKMHKLILTGYGVTATPRKGADMSDPKSFFDPKKIERDSGVLRVTTSYYAGRTRQGEIVAQTPNKRRGVCSGDSGGPLFVVTKSPKSGRMLFYQFGVAARSNCHQTAWYTDTRAHSEWIKRANRFVNGRPLKSRR